MMNHDMYSSQIENRSLVAEQQARKQTSVYHSSVYMFRDIEHVIQLAHRLPQPFFNSKLYGYKQLYYLVVFFPENRTLRGNWVESVILEYGERCHLTVYRLDEYGKRILSENAVATIKDCFKCLA